MTFPAYQQLGYIPPLQPRGPVGSGFSVEDQRAYIKGNQEAEKQKVELKSKKHQERLKNQVWTRDDLRKLVYEQEKILDTHFGDPQTFSDDMHLIKTLIQKEKGEIKLEGTEKEKINKDGINFLYGLLIHEHIIHQNFYIEIGPNNQPIIHDNQTPERTAQVQGLQTALGKIEFGVDRHHLLRKYDNVSNVATYLAAAAYHLQPEKDLLKYRENLEKKIQDNPNVALTAAEIQSSGLDAGQKSFLLAWGREKQNDAGLTLLQKHQQDFVERSRDNVGKKSTEQHREELRQRPIGKSIELFGAGIIGVGLLAFGLKQMFGESSGPLGKFFGVIMAFIGGMVALPMGDKAWQAMGGPEMLDGFAGDKPTRRENAEDNPINVLAQGASEAGEKIKDKITRMHQRISAGPDEWTPLLMKPGVGDSLVKYPAGALMYTLYADADMPSEKSGFESYKNNLQNKEIEKTLKKLSVPEKTQLIALMENSWERQKSLDATVVAKDHMRVDTQKLTLGGMIEEIDDQDKWYNTLPSWVGWGNGALMSPVTFNREKTEALKVMSHDMEKWGDITLERLKKYFIDGETGLEKDKEIFELLGKTTNTNSPENYDAMKLYITQILTTSIDSQKTLRQSLS